MEVIIYIIIFIIGAFIGSFSSLAVYRIPLKEDILIKHSYCPNCKEKLVLKDLIPIFSYLFLRGKCSHCGNKIRLRYLILEVLSGIFFLLFILSLNIDLYNISIDDLLVILFVTIFFVSLMLIAAIDKEKRNIESSIISFNIFFIAIYIVYLNYLKINILYDVIVYALVLTIYLLTLFIKNKANKVTVSKSQVSNSEESNTKSINMWFTHVDKKNYIYYIIILVLMSRFFVNSYIIFFDLILTFVTCVLYRVLNKKTAPFAFYYIIYLISTFIGCNFIL